MCDFFAKKRDWSRHKDFILGYYLEPYIPKVNTLKRQYRPTRVAKQKASDQHEFATTT